MSENNSKKPSWLRSILTPSGRRAKKKFESSTESEADKIFVKLYPQWAKRDGTFSAISENSPGGMVKDYRNVLKKVREVRGQNK